MSWRARIMALALLVLAAWEIVVVTRAKGVPGDAEWRRAADVVIAGQEPGDLVLFAPRWIDPIGRKWLGSIMSQSDVSRMDVARYHRIWEVSIRGAEAPESRGLTLAQESTVGNIHVRLFTQIAKQVTWDLRKRSDLYEVDYEPRECVLLRVVGGKTSSLTTNDAKLSSELAVYAGLADFRSRKENYAYARVRVFVDGQEVARVSVGNDDGWRALPVAQTSPGAHQVEIEAAVDDTLGDPSRARLDVCVAAEARS